MNWYEIIMTILTVVFGFLSVYIRTKTNVVQKATEAINCAETAYRDYTNVSSKKMEFAVDWVMQYVPGPLKLIFTRELVEKIIQAAFDEVQEFATKQLDKIVNKVSDDLK